MSDLLIVLTTADSAATLPPLAAALGRAGVAWECFVTGAGARALADPATVAALAGAAQAVACEHSWEIAKGHLAAGEDLPCPIEAGSQFHLSMMLGDARRTLSL